MPVSLTSKMEVIEYPFLYLKKTAVNCGVFDPPANKGANNGKRTFFWPGKTERTKRLTFLMANESDTY